LVANFVSIIIYYKIANGICVGITLLLIL